MFAERAAPSTRLLGAVSALHERGLALVYGAALAGWSYLLAALGIPAARGAGGAIGAVVGVLATVAARLARALAAQGRDAEAEGFTGVTERTAARGDLAAQIEWRSVPARLLTRRGEADAAEELAREALELSEWTDASSVQAAALADLAAVMGAAGRDDEAAPLLARALELHERRGNVAAARAVARA